MRARHWIILSALVGCMCPAFHPAVAQDRDRDRDRVRLDDRDLDRERSRLRDQLRQDIGLSDAEWGSMAPEAEGFLRGGGHGEELRRTVTEAHAGGCRGECLAEAVRSMNRARSRGLTEAEARELVTEEVRAQVRERNERGEALAGREMGEELRERVENALRHRERERTRPTDDNSRGRGFEREEESGSRDSRGDSDDHNRGGGRGGGGKR